MAKADTAGSAGTAKTTDPTHALRAAKPAGTTDAVQTGSIGGIERSLFSVVRYLSLPRVRARLAADAGLDLEPAGYAILAGLGLGRSLRLSDLASGLGVDLSVVSRQVKALEAAGLVRRESDPTDGRAALVTATAEGRRTVERLGAARRAALSAVLDQWPEADRARLADLLERLHASLVAFGGELRA